MRSKPSVTNEYRQRQTERLANTLQIPLSLAHLRPARPRLVMFSADTVVWDAPREMRNVTHFNIYAPDERTLVIRVPAAQREYYPVTAPTAAVSAWNETNRKESVIVPAASPVPWLP